MSSRRMVLGLATALLGVLATSANADPLTVFNSGVDGQGNVLAPGAADPHYQLTTVPQGEAFTTPGAALVQSPHPAFIPNDPVGGAGSSWIGSQQNAAGQIAGGVFVFRTTVDLTGFDPATAQLDGNVAVDNGLDDILVNGVSQGITGGQFIAFSVPFTLTSGFVEGVNTIEFVVRNLSPGPSGLRVLLSGDATPVVPESDLEVRMDARLGSRSNRIRLNSRGANAAVLFGSDDLDVRDVDLDSVRLAGASVLTTRKGRQLAKVCDLDRDGVDDLLFLVKIRSMDLTEDTTEVTLEARLDDGTELAARDAVKVVKRRRGHCRGWGHRDRDEDDGNDDA